MFDLTLIGIGTGNPDHLTGQAARAIREADLILIPRKGAGKEDLADLRHQIIDRVCGDSPPQIAGFDMPERDPSLAYGPRVERWHDEIAARWIDAIAAIKPTPRTVALLVWGDPSLYDSTLRIASRLEPKPATRVIAGITSLQALTAAHAIPLNAVGAPVQITTGRRLRENGWPEAAETVAVMLDGGCAFETLDGAAYNIWWGAYLGMPEEILMAGPLGEVGPQIVAKRAAAREAHGWIMDTYLLKRRFQND